MKRRRPASTGAQSWVKVIHQMFVEQRRGGLITLLAYPDHVSLVGIDFGSLLWIQICRQPRQDGTKEKNEKRIYNILIIHISHKFDRIGKV